MKELAGSLVSVHAGDNEDLRKDAQAAAKVELAAQIAAKHTTNSGEPVAGRMFPKYALGLRGVVGVVDVPGTINAGDRVIVQVYESE